MKKSSNTMIIVIAVLVVAALATLFWLLGPKQQKHNWYETYKIDDREPYGTYVIGSLLEKYHPQNKFTVNVNKPVSELLDMKNISSPASYVMIGENLFLDSADAQTMLKFVTGGNDVFISSLELPYTLTINLPDFQCYWKGYKYDTDTTAKMNFVHSSLKEIKPYQYTYWRRDEASAYYWAYFEPDYLCGYTNSLTRLGYFTTVTDSEHLNFVKIPYGKGNFYFHTSPLVFTNYFLLNERAIEYAGKSLSHLRPGDIIWDEYSRVPHYKGEKGGRGEHGDSPLQFLLQQKSMRWAWFTMLFGVVLMYLLFRTKRKQRIIPLLEPNTNTSLEFVQTIGRLYFLQNNHRGLFRQMMRYYLSFIRNKYYLSTAKVTDELITKIAQRSKVDKEIISGIFSQYNLADKTATEISDKELIAFHQSLEYFYKNCK